MCIRDSLVLLKHFGLWMSQDCVCFLFRLRNAGAYIPKGTRCTFHISTVVCVYDARKVLIGSVICVYDARMVPMGTVICVEDASTIPTDTVICVSDARTVYAVSY